jgi:hypothetical protein
MLQRMDTSKLPKLSNSPAPPQPAMPVEYASRRTSPLAMSEVAFDLFFLAVLGLILMMLGSPFGGWLMAKARGQTYPTGVNWTAGPQAGQPVELFELEGATGWQYAGEWIGGVALLLAAVVLAAGVLMKLKRNGVLTTAAALTVVAVIANGLAAGAVFQAGIQPLLSLILMLLCGISGYSLFRHKPGGALT